MKKLTPILLLLSILSISSQNTLGVLSNTNEALDGYMLFSPRTSSSEKNTYLLNNCGEIVNQWSSSFPLFSTDYLLEDGSLYRSVVDNQSTLDIPGNTGRIEHLDWDNNLIWALTYSDIDFSFHHDYVPLANGNILMLVARRRTANEAIANGRDPSTLATNELYEEMVLEIEPIGTSSFNVVWQWNSWDHLIQDFDITKANFGVVADHPELMDINFGANFGEADWWHSNALSYSPEFDQIILSNRNFDEFIIIDHSTTTQEASSSSGGNSGMGGDIIYRYGNPESYDHGTEADRKLDGQHDVQFIPSGLPNAGKILIFNNGLDLGFTKIQIIAPPYDAVNQNYTYNGMAYGPDTVDWEYIDSNPTDFYAAFLSGAQQLPNGNILICHGPNGYVFEIDTSGNKVWEYQSPVANIGILDDGTDPATEQTRLFRSVKYNVNYSGFDGRDLTPSGVVELNPQQDNCTLSIDDIEPKSLVSIYPTITKDIINIDLLHEVADIKIRLYDVTGNHIDTFEFSPNINVSHLDPGLYFLNIVTDTNFSIFKFIKK